MTDAPDSWRPTATRAMLEKRAAMLARARQFFAERGVLEVDTPVVVNAPVTDVHIHSARVTFSSHDGERTGFLQTSPEYAMKRLLAAGSGDIYQICHVVREFERGRLHNAEFTLIEWYRVGFTLEQLMDEVALLVRSLLGPVGEHRRVEHLTYREAFLRELQIDPLACEIHDLERAARAIGFTPARSPERDELLDLLMGAVVGPKLGQNALTFVYAYPASQAALAQLNPKDPLTALRFELYADGMELANGFHELASSAEQRARFVRDQQERQQRRLPVLPMDERLLAALDSGLPDCAGVALGFDRIVMLATGARHIDAVLPFPSERA